MEEDMNYIRLLEVRLVTKVKSNNDKLYLYRY
jgi:hypothetical protein